MCEILAKKLTAVGLVTLESYKPYAKVASSIGTRYFVRLKKVKKNAYKVSLLTPGGP